MLRQSVPSRPGWVQRALVAGFVGTALAGIVLLIAYALATALGQVLPGTLGRWFHALTFNQATALVQDGPARALLLHIVVGLAWALVYAALAEPRLQGPGWQRGATFALIPWVLSLVVFLPLVGGGFLGLAIGAGPLPIIGNLILHLVYGVSVGELYALEVAESEEAVLHPESLTMRANLSAEQGVAIGMVVAGLAGAVVGILAVLIVGDGSVPITVGALAGAVFGAAGGALVGSFVGLSRA